MYKRGGPEHEEIVKQLEHALGGWDLGTSRERVYIEAQLLMNKWAIDELTKKLNMEKAVNTGVQRVVGELLKKAVINV